MARLPQVGGDRGSWGQVLNEFLAQAHNSDGSIKDSAISDAAIADGTITNTKIADGTITNTEVSASAGIAQSKIANLTSDLAGKLNASGGVLASDLDADSNKITGLADGVGVTDASTVGQLSAAISDVETDLASTGTEITDLPTATIQDASWLTSFPSNQNYIPIVQNGVAKKMPIELLNTMEMTTTVSVTGTSHTWAVGESVLACSNTGSLIITLPTFASTPGLNAPIRVMRGGTGSVTLQAGSSVVINKAASLPLTLRQQYSVAYFWPYYWVGGTTIYLAWGDLG